MMKSKKNAEVQDEFISIVPFDSKILGIHAESTSHGCLQDWLRKHREMMVFYDGFLAGFWLCTTWEKGVLYKQSIKLVHNFILSSSQYLLSFADCSLNLNIWLPGCSFQFHWICSGRSHLPGNLMPRWCSATSHKSLNLKFPMKVESLPEKWVCFFCVGFVE